MPNATPYIVVYRKFPDVEDEVIPQINPNIASESKKAKLNEK